MVVYLLNIGRLREARDQVRGRLSGMLSGRRKTEDGRQRTETRGAHHEHRNPGVQHRRSSRLSRPTRFESRRKRTQKEVAQFPVSSAEFYSYAFGEAQNLDRQLIYDLQFVGGPGLAIEAKREFHVDALLAQRADQDPTGCRRRVRRVGYQVHHALLKLYDLIDGGR